MNQYSSDKYVLIKDKELKCGYFIMDKESKFSLIEDDDLAETIIKKLLDENTEIFEDIVEYQNKYPALSSKEKLARSMAFQWFAVPKEKWTDRIKDYFENDSYWKEFFIKNDVANNKDKYIG